jgi:LPS-assembly protein
MIAQLNWRSQLIDPIGEVFTPFVSARGDLYQINGFVVPKSPPGPPDPAVDDTVTRATGTVGLQYEYPFVSHASWGSQVFSPIAQILVRPNTVEQGRIPNEDAQSLVFDDTLLFDTDKFSGYDRIETGTRANVGVQYTAQGNNGSHMRAVLGQSIHVAGDNPFAAGTGLQTDRSDYVAGLYLAPNGNLELISKSRFDTATLSLRREDLGMAVTAGPITVASNYAFERTKDQLGVDHQEQEILSSANLKLTENWSALASARYNIDTKDFITDSVGLKYANDCLGVSVTYSESRIIDQDVQPNQTVLLRVDLKNLGGTTFRTDTLGSTAATSNGAQQ